MVSPPNTFTVRRSRLSGIPHAIRRSACQPCRASLGTSMPQAQNVTSMAPLIQNRLAAACAGVAPPTIVPGDFTYDGGVAAMRALARLGQVPDAVICANDYTAIGCIDEARHGLKLRVPQDISIVGFDGAAPARWASYDLVPVRQPTQTMVNAAIDMLMARIEDPDMGIEKRSYSGELVLGSSARIA